MQAALTVLTGQTGRQRYSSIVARRLNLQKLGLRAADPRDANLVGANLFEHDRRLEPCAGRVLDPHRERPAVPFDQSAHADSMAQAPDSRRPAPGSGPASRLGWHEGVTAGRLDRRGSRREGA